MGKAKALSETQRLMLKAIREEPGIRFGVATRKAGVARTLAGFGLAEWDCERWGQSQWGGWYLTEEGKKAAGDEPVPTAD